MKRPFALLGLSIATTSAAAMFTSLSLAQNATRSSSPTSKTDARSAVQAGDEGGIAGGTLSGPDVVVSNIGSTFSEYGVVNGVGGYAITTVSCNLGEADAEWFANTNHHPVIAQNAYRLKDGRFEQIGMSWLKHGWCAADAPSCGSPVEQNSSCDWLGTHATDTYGADLNADQFDLGPRSEVEPWKGQYVYPYGLGWNLTGNGVYKRLQIKQVDVDPAQNTGAIYFAEGQYVCTDEQVVNRYNNVTYRPFTVGTQSGGQWNLSFSGSSTWQQPAINAWRATDPQVVLTNLDVPGDGRMILGYRVTDLGNGQWHYEYALYNMNSHRGAQGFSVPVPAGVTLSNVGFHDVDYHSGEPFANTDWAATEGAGAIAWSTQTIGENANANALRWGTLYNFRFDADAPPKCVNAGVNLFRAGNPASLNIAIVGPSSCPADFAPAGGGNGAVDVDDLIAVILAWGPCAPGATSACGCPADIAPAGGNDAIDVDDLIAVILNWGPCQ